MKSTTTTRFVALNATRRNSTGAAQGGSRGSNSHTATASTVATSRSAMPLAASAAPAGSGSPGLESLEALRVSLTATVPLIDPTGCGGLIQVPVTKTMYTKGRTEYFQGMLRKDVSLCCLFQKGRCHAAEKCHQIHVDGTFIKNVRTQNAHVISCCRACKDTASLSANAVTFFATHCDRPTVKILAPDGRFSLITNMQMALTIGLTQHVEQLRAGSSLSYIPAKKMCRLHLRGACKYAKDCKNLHLCSQLGEGILVGTHSPLPEERRGSTSSSSRSSSAKTSHTPTTTPVATAAGILDRNTAPPPAAVGESLSRSDSLHTQEEEEEQDSLQHLPTTSSTPQQEDALEQPLSFSQADMTNLSFLNQSLAMPGLCFDPTMALSWEDTESKHQSKNLSGEWFDDACGCSSTTSQHTPSKMLW